MNSVTKNNTFSNCYLALREKESRLMSDAELRLLPQTKRSHPHANEWKIRGWAAKKLKGYLETKQSSLSILEVGCGNGWLSNMLSGIRGSEITGIDINREELRQARRVFGDKTNIRFFPGTIQELMPSFRFDIIVFAASIQYFSDLDTTIIIAQNLLNPGGEIHILDSHFYTQEKVDGAKKRSRDYFIELNEPGMTEFYFHHSLSALSLFNYKWMYNPDSLISKLRGMPSPFPWIRIDK